MNLGYEFLQELIIKTAANRILRLHIGKQSNSYRLYGEYFDTKEWTLVEFSSTRSPQAKPLLDQCIKDFAAAMAGHGDKIQSLENPCNAPFVTKLEQEALLLSQSISATVTVNPI